LKKLRTQLETKSVAFPDFEGYAFAAGDVSEGRNEEGESIAHFGCSSSRKGKSCNATRRHPMSFNKELHPPH